MDYKPTINEGLRELALFAGAGGGILGGQLLGWRTVCAVEIEPYAASVLIARQNDGLLPHFPIWDDVCTFSGNPWRGIVDVVSGGFPCTDISCAGKGAGITGEKSGLWKEFARIIREVRPRFCFVENSPVLTSRGLDTVLGDLAALGYDAEWGVLGAADVGAPHQRDRIWILAYSSMYNAGQPTEQAKDNQKTKNITGVRRKFCNELAGCAGWATEPKMDRVVNGMADWLDDQQRVIGNGQVPACAAEAWRLLIDRIKYHDNKRTSEKLPRFQERKK